MVEEKKKMTEAQKNQAIKEKAVALFAEVFAENDAIQTGTASYALEVEVDGESRYAEVVITAKSNKATTRSQAYDPFEKQAEWETETKLKAEAKESKKATADAKKARDAAKRKAEKEAKEAKEA